MELTLHPLAKICHASGHAFVEGDRVISHLVREPGGEITRRDVLAGASENGPVAGVLLCSWTVSYKARHAEENAGRALKLTAENLFVTLADPAAEPNPVNVPMIQFLGLLLERKKMLRPRGVTPDGERQIYEHAKTHQLYEVPVGKFDEEFFTRIQSQLDLLVGPSKKNAAEAATNSS